MLKPKEVWVHNCGASKVAKLNHKRKYMRQVNTITGKKFTCSRCETEGETHKLIYYLHGCYLVLYGKGAL